MPVPFAFACIVAVTTTCLVTDDAQARPAASFVDTLGETAAPAGYLDMCGRERSPFCATQNAGRVEMATTAAPTIAGVKGDAPTAAISPMHNPAAIVVGANDSIASLFQPADIAIKTKGGCDTARSFSYGHDANPFALYPQGLGAIDDSALRRQIKWDIWNAELANDNMAPWGSSFCARLAPRTNLLVSTELSFTLWNLPLLTPRSALDSAPALRPAAVSVPSDVIDPAQAMVAPSHRPIAARALSKMLKAENLFVNARTQQMKDELRFGQEERWERSYTGAGARGDCEDLAIEKRIRLIEAGFPADRLSFGVVYRADVGLHAVLVARLDTGDYVLDSLSPFVERWDKVPYMWISLQNPARQDDWRAVRNPHQKRQTQMVQYRIVVSS